MRSLLLFFESRAGRVVRTLVSVSLLTGFVLLIDWRQIGQLKGQFQVLPVSLAILLAGVSYPLHAWRWWMLFRVQGIGLSLHWSHVVTWIANFYGAILLGGLGGDAARAYYICRDAPSQKTGGLASIAIDRLLGLAILLLMALAAVALKFQQVAASPEFRHLAIVAAVLLLAGVIATGVLFARSPDRWPGWLRRRLGAGRCALFADLRQRTLDAPGVHFVAFLLSVVVWLLDFVSVWLLALGVGLPLPFFETCIAVSVAYASTALPISIGGHGVREGALLFVLGVFGLIMSDGPDRERALLLAVLVWVVTMIWSLFGGIVMVLTRRPRVPAASP